MYKQNIVGQNIISFLGFIGLVAIFVILGLLLTGCSPAIVTDAPFEEPSTGENPSQGAYPPANNEAPPDSVATSPPYPLPGEPVKPDWLPAPEDKGLEKGEVFIDEAGLLVLESYPPQFKLSIRGSLPTPCHNLRVHLAEPDAQKRILVQVYSVVDPRMMCTQMLKEFEASIPIPTPTSGEKYTVWLNGEQVGEIEW